MPKISKRQGSVPIHCGSNGRPVARHDRMGRQTG